jgi:hypothetical protein
MKTGFFNFTPVSVGAFLVCIGLTNLCATAISAYAEEAKATAPQVVGFHNLRVPRPPEGRGRSKSPFRKS